MYDDQKNEFTQQPGAAPELSPDEIVPYPRSAASDQTEAVEPPPVIEYRIEGGVEAR